MAKPLYENENATTLFDVPLYMENTEIRANRIDARIVDQNEKNFIIIEMSCPMLENRLLKDFEKAQKYGTRLWELKRQLQCYEVSHRDIMMDVLGEYCKDVGKTVETFASLERGENPKAHAEISTL